MQKEIFVVKRDKRKEPLDIAKIHQVIQWACEGVDGVSPSEVEHQAKIKFFNGMKTSDLHQSLVDAAHELITEYAYNYDLVAGRLSMYDVRKKVYGKFEPDHILDIVRRNVKDGWYDNQIEGLYTADQWEQINNYIKHDRDFKFKIAAVRELRSKYLVKNRKTGEMKESPQIAYMLTAAIMMNKYVADEGMKIVFDYYDDLSSGDQTIPTPVLAGVRTPVRQYASCTVIESGDSLPSITATVDAIIQYASRKAGLGVGVYNLRAEKQPVRGGAVTTTGPVPFTQLMQSAVLSCSQGGVRKGSVTFFHNIWHKDVLSLLVLKNNKGTEETRARHSDHGFNINGYLYRKMMKGEDMYLFSPEEVPDLQKAFFDDQDKFAELYEKYSKSSRVNKVKVNARDIRDLMINERGSTSRVYIHNVDNSNTQGSFLPEQAPIKQSNLCLEITLPTIPLQTFDDPDGLISLCTLSAINWGKIKTPQQMEGVCTRAVYALDSLLDYQEYPLRAAENSTKFYRPLGIGINNLAYFLAKRGLTYGAEALPVIDEYMEAMSYYLIKASVQLAKKYGACGKSEHTRYSAGQFPHTNRKSTVDELVPHQTRFDWDSLREDMVAYGIRNATLMAHMPSETSSRVQNLTNGVEPIRHLITVKDGMSIVAPEPNKLKNKYVSSWDVEVEDYLKVMAVIQKWTDQSISANTTYDASKFTSGQIPGSLLWRHILLAYRFGVKTLYYQNNVKPDAETSPDEVCESCVI